MAEICVVVTIKYEFTSDSNAQLAYIILQIIIHLSSATAFALYLSLELITQTHEHLVMLLHDLVMLLHEVADRAAYYSLPLSSSENILTRTSHKYSGGRTKGYTKRTSGAHTRSCTLCTFKPLRDILVHSERDNHSLEITKLRNVTTMKILIASRVKY